MIYNRNRGQKYVEETFGFFSPETFTCYIKAEYENNLKGLPILSIKSAKELSEDLQRDAKDFFFKAVLSISEGLNGIHFSRYSWATVKLYYGVYYLIRTSLCLENIALIVANGMYYIKADHNATLVKMQKGPENNSTHKGAIKMYLKLLGSKDIISLTSSIGGESPYFFLIDTREIINYREREFHEPECSNMWLEIKRDKDKYGLGHTIKKYLSDVQTMAFEEYACLSMPIFKLKDVYNRFKNIDLFTDEQMLILDNLWTVNGEEIFNLEWFIEQQNPIPVD